MGCGGSAAKPPAEEKQQPKEAKTKPEAAAGQQTQQSQQPSSGPKQGSSAAAAPAASSPQASTSPRLGTTAPASGAPSSSPAQPADQGSPTDFGSEARNTYFPAPQIIETTAETKERFAICCFYDPSYGKGALRFALRVDTKEGGEKLLVDAETALFTKDFSDEELISVRDGLPKGPDGAVLEWKSFWKMLNTAFTYERVKVTGGGSGLEIKMKQSKEPYAMTWSVELNKGVCSVALVYEHFIRPFPKVYIQRRKQAAEESKEAAKDKKELREVDFAKAEAEGSSRLHPWTVSESIVLAAESAERRLTSVLPELAEEAKKKRRQVGKQQNQMVKMGQQIEIFRDGAASHPLDTLYACPNPKGTAGPSQLDGASLGWDTDTDDLDFVEVAVCLFEHHGLIEYFNMDKDLLASYFTAVKQRCNDNPYRNAKRATAMMCIMSHLLGSADSPSSLISRVRMSKEDVFAALLSAGIVDLNHEGVTNAFVKRSGTMLSMLYSDLYATDQDSLTVAFELMYNPHINILKELSPEQVKDVTETVREALFIRANVQMADPMARFEEFRQLVASSVHDWAVKDNVRHAITHAVRICDLAAWGRPLELHKKWMDRVREEFYLQGDRETKLGLSPSTYHDTPWTTARERDDSDFAAGQVHFIDSMVLPLFLEMQRLVPEMEQFAKEAKENRAHWEQAGGLKAGHFKKALQSFGKIWTTTNGGAVNGMVAFARPGPDVVRPGLCLWISAVGTDGVSFVAQFDEAGLSKHGLSLKAVQDAFNDAAVKTVADNECCQLTIGEATLRLEAKSVQETQSIYASLKSTFELRRHVNERQKDIDKQLDKLEQQAKNNRDKALLLEGEARALRSCIEACNKQIEEDRVKLEDIEKDLQREAGNRPVEKMKMEREDALSIKVRNPLKTPLPPGVTKPPDCKDVDRDLLQIVKSKFFQKKEGAKADLENPLDPQECLYVNAVQPMLTSEFCQATSKIDDPTRGKIFDLLKKLDDWDYDVFELQTAMSGGFSGECIREQPHGGALFVTMYALVYKWQFMQKFNLNEQVLLNWLSIVEAGYHPNPYHNSMHAADVLHVTHYIINKGGLQKKIKCTDEEIFAALFAATVHDYNHPGINNAFHVRSQNYLAVLFNDRSVNENIHASSVFELMRMDEFNLLKTFRGPEYTRMRDDVVEFILGTDMGLHAMFVSRFKKRLELTDSKMYRSKADRNLALTMAVKMADISNCGRKKELYHGWCNVIVDEFFQQGDRERLQGMPVSPFMDRYTTVMSKGQIGFMNFIVMPLFECMGEYLEDMHMATAIAEENKGFWQENEDW